jgi:chaperonin GroES
MASPKGEPDLEGDTHVMATKLTPLHDRILVRRVEAEETARGGIIIPDTAKEKPQEGVVVAVGTGKREKGELIPLAVKEGDRILFGKYAGNEVRIDDEELVIMREEEVLGILSGAGRSAEREAVGAGKKGR